MLCLVSDDLLVYLVVTNLYDYGFSFLHASARRVRRA